MIFPQFGNATRCGKKHNDTICRGNPRGCPKCEPKLNSAIELRYAKLLNTYNHDVRPYVAHLAAAFRIWVLGDRKGRPYTTTHTTTTTANRAICKYVACATRPYNGMFSIFPINEDLPRQLLLLSPF
ncbi:hypothetical protein R83H12_02148 [Fibrobacteria bacterium R8-3-H12]